ncbi:hypothetical protein PTUN_a2303 [Pseudoalteromonas tunicata]|nr:hypothetical protein PTUN_a2303 [Pseudoalteromonas tunicata]AXT30500.1 hypothetical protein D1819_06465 [Pseudoalteromonas tunicata]
MQFGFFYKDPKHDNNFYIKNNHIIATELIEELRNIDSENFFRVLELFRKRQKLIFPVTLWFLIMYFYKLLSA